MSDYKIEIEIYEGKGGHLQKTASACFPRQAEQAQCHLPAKI